MCFFLLLSIAPSRSILLTYVWIWLRFFRTGFSRAPALRRIGFSIFWFLWLFLYRLVFFLEYSVNSLTFVTSLFRFLLVFFLLRLCVLRLRAKVQNLCTLDVRARSRWWFRCLHHTHTHSERVVACEEQISVSIWSFFLFVWPAIDGVVKVVPSFYRFNDQTLSPQE